MPLAAHDLPATVDLPVHGETRIDPSTIDPELLERMNKAALELASDEIIEARIDRSEVDRELLDQMNHAALQLAADELVGAAHTVIARPARNAAEADANALQAAHLMLAATLTRSGSI